MKIGVTLRNMGPQSTPHLMLQGALAAEQRGFDSIWITDHIAIPPDDAEGSDGRYTDPLATIAWLAGQTRSIALGIGVLVVPYRPVLPTLKQIATIQELSNNRLLLGVAVGWMDSEFKALGVDRHQRGKITDQFLQAFRAYFSNDVMTLNDQPFITKPHPVAPPVYIGGSAKHALPRAINSDNGWLPMTRDPSKLSDELAMFRHLGAVANKQPGPVTILTRLPLTDIDAAARLIKQYYSLGIERLVCAPSYDSADDYMRQLDSLIKIRECTR